ncbi:MAG: homoserine dehydrogenase [Anaerolineaceae bacterium]|nr:homoserine dehydrogenase [Anaerolineaceae bacterium]
MQSVRVAMIGFGNVGQGFVQILRDHGEQLAHQYDVQITVVAISDIQKGSLYNASGLDPAALLKAVATTGKIDSVSAPHHGWDALRTINDTASDTILELSYTDLKTGEPAFTHLSHAIKAGKHVVTSNKGPIALHYPELKALADANHVQIGIEGTVMSGTPSLHLGSEFLSAAGIVCIQGIINGTTNYILTQMEAGSSYSAALAEAQAAGYAEADPTGDVEGYDAAGKTVILANLLMGGCLKMEDIDRTGITQLTPQDITDAQSKDERWKLIAKVECSDGKVTGSVRPTRLSTSHPLASVSGATNAITFTTQLLGDITLVGPGAGRLETGYALLTDLLAMHKKV